MTPFILFLTTVGAVIYLKSLLGPNITASTSVGCRDTSPICVNASRSTSGDSNTSIEIRLNKWWSLECYQIRFEFSWLVTTTERNGPHTFSSLLHFNIWWMGLSNPKSSSDRIQWDRSFATCRLRQTFCPLGHLTSQSLVELLIFCLPDFMLTYCR